jgi:nifR3 family TIM-barrel protein
MEFGFWKKIKKPFFAIAPMSDVTDIAFREMFAKYGAPDVFWTEFVSCDGLCSRGREKLLIDLKYTKKQKPIVAQFFGATPEHFYKCALLAKELGFNGIDINMGCPDRAVEKQGAGAALIKNPKLAQEIMKETKRGAGKLPVSVKTRLGYNKDEMENWLPYIFEMEPAAITIHGRTRKEMSKVPARWNRIADVVALRDGYFSDNKQKPLIIGNGDVVSVEDGIKKAKEYGVDGIMVGRRIFGNPWFFNKKRKLITEKERMLALLEHTRFFEKYFGSSNTHHSTSMKNFDNMKKHFKAYVSGFGNAKELRIKLMNIKSADEMELLFKKLNYFK